MPEQQESGMHQHVLSSEDDEEISLLNLLIVLARHKRLVIGMPLVTGIVAMVFSLTMAPVFTSTAKILPPQQQGSGLAAAMVGQLGGLVGVASNIAGLKTRMTSTLACLKAVP